MASKTHTLFVNQIHTKPLRMISSPKLALFQVLAIHFRIPKRKTHPTLPHVFCQEEFNSVSGVVKIELLPVQLHSCLHFTSDEARFTGLFLV
jgi:hypothetical protein